MAGPTTGCRPRPQATDLRRCGDLDPTIGPAKQSPVPRGDERRRPRLRSPRVSGCTIGEVTRPPRVEYARTEDGLDIAYTVAGDGPRDVVMSHGFTTHLDLMHNFAWHVTWDRALSEHFRVITFDKRGSGLSDRSLGLGSIEDRTNDLLAVLDAAGSERASLVGISEGAPMSLVLAASKPHRVDRIAIYGGFARLAAGPDFPEGVSPELQTEFVEMMGELWGTGQVLGEIFIDCPPDQLDIAARLERSACTPQMAQDVLRANLSTDVRSILSAISAPTMVLHNEDDPLIDPAAGRAIADGIAGADFRGLPGGWHGTGYVDRALPVVEAAVEFLLGDEAAGSTVSPNRMLASVLFTDIVGSTEQAAELGDASWTGVLSRHDALATSTVERHGGRIVNRTGDGMLALFDGPSRGIECARELRRLIGALGIHLRAGLHTGEIERRGDDVGGIGVHISARVESAAEPGEILVTRTVRDLTAGSGVEFDDRGSHALKGVPEDWQLFAVVD